MIKKTIIILETPNELFEACNRVVQQGRDKVVIPDTVYLVFDGDSHPFLSGDGSQEFQLSSDITQSELIVAAFKRLGIALHNT